jgi:cytoskeleton protein RodZ
MSEVPSTDASAQGAAPASTASHPGATIRAAREARGQSLLHLSILLKISERRLQAFEEGRWADVGDRTFVRALAQSLCKHLGLDAQPVLQALPTVGADVRPLADRGRLAQASAASMPRPVAMPRDARLPRPFTPVRMAVGVILAGALALAMAPADWWSTPAKSVVVVSDPPVAAEPAPVPSDAPSDAPSAPPGAPASEPSAPALAAAASPAPSAVVADTTSLPLQLKATQDTWVQVTDAKGGALLSRLLRAGETVGLEGARPLRLRVGNAAGTEATWQGRRIALDEIQRNNVADVELP